MDAGEGEYPVVIEKDGIKLKAEKMVVERLYHCVYQNKVFLFYKDEQDLLHCYEVEDPRAVNEIAVNPSQLESILKKYAALNEE